MARFMGLLPRGHLPNAASPPPHLLNHELVHSGACKHERSCPKSYGSWRKLCKVLSIIPGNALLLMSLALQL